MRLRNITTPVRLSGWLCTLLLAACTKYQNGFISGTMQYSVSTFTVTKGHLTSSNSLVSDGSSIPLHITWTHIYDANGNVVDSLFTKTYPVGTWTSAYNSKTDTTYSEIMAKRTTTDLPPIQLNETSGVLTANSGSYYLPVGTYSMDLKVTNTGGTSELKNAMTIILQDGDPVEITPQTGNFAAGRAAAGTAPVTYFYNGSNNPYVMYTVTRIADTPNRFVLKFTDRNGVPFDPKTGEIIKRPNTGVNPSPVYLQNLQDYAPDTYVATDTAISILYPLTPFPIASLGNGYNMYYNINTSALLIDSTSSWSGNSAGVYYKGTSDSHYLGVYAAGRYDYSIRTPMRIQVPGSYELTVKILNVTHR